MIITLSAKPYLDLKKYLLLIPCQYFKLDQNQIKIAKIEIF